MEELQDAIEDAQYVNAIATLDDGPRPVIPWELPNEEQLAEWEEKVKKQVSEAPELDYEAFGIDWTISSPIGLFLFSSFVKTVKKDYPRVNFIEEVCRFRRFQYSNNAAVGQQKFDKAKEILSYFLKPPKTDKETGEIILPKQSEIDEYDLERIKPTNLQMTQEELESFFAINLEMPAAAPAETSTTAPPTTTEETAVSETANETPAPKPIMKVTKSSSSTVGVKGPILEEVFQTMRQCQKSFMQSAERAESMPALNHSSSNTPIKKRESDITTKSAEGSEGRSDGGGSAAPGDDVEKPAQQRPSKNGTTSLGSSDFDDQTTSMRKLTRRMKSTETSAIRSDIFDKVDLLVIESLRRDYWDDFAASEQYKKLKNFLWYQDRPVVQDDFFIMRVLGRGGFGLVNACKKGTSGKLYAMKVMNKRRIKMKKSEQLAINEMMALAAVESNFVCNLKYSFHSKDDIFLILDLMTGGDLGYHLHQKGRFPKRECLYYAARIMLGLQALHDQQYVYRDLKPENCLLADDGRVKITDLGLATKITPTLHGAAGTRGYWAPEMLRRDKKGKRMPYGHTVDWFSFGCCVAEFISGSNPFRSEAALNFGLEHGKQTKEKAIDCATLEMDPKFDPEKFEPDAADLCRRLLDKNEKKRLGSKGCEEIMAHPWFKSVNWESIISDRKRPPYVPPKDVNAASQSEIGTFAEDKALQETVIEQKDEEVYKNWDWTNHRAFAAEVIEFLIYERETGEPLLPVTQHASCCCSIL